MSKPMYLGNHLFNKKYRAFIALCLLVIFVFAGCSFAGNAVSDPEVVTVLDKDLEERSTENMLKLFINDEEIQVTWEENESVEALKNMALDNPVIIDMSMYGGFEQVGSIGQSLPKNDKQMTMSSGDIVLYSGNQMVVFYGSNSWAYTKLGHIDGKSKDELEKLLGNGDVIVTLKY